MKKLLLIVIALFSLHGFAQKTLEIYNLTPHILRVTTIATNASGAYPQFIADFSPLNSIFISPGNSYILQNTNLTRFPFHSPSSSPYISSWLRLTSASTYTSVASPAAWVLGNSQVFQGLTFHVIDNGAATLGGVSVTAPNFTAPNWSAHYSQLVSGTAIAYTITLLP